ncbi:MAG: PaaI family thioesterase [Candidatus Binatia bacterium]
MSTSVLRDVAATRGAAVIDAARRFALALEGTAYAGRLGLVCGDMTSDFTTARVPYVPSLANAQGYVHGGVAASLSLWTAMTLAVASDRARASAARPVSVSVNYLAAAREEALHATARVATRGRDLVHVEVEVVTERGRPVAAALAVLRTSGDEPSAGVPGTLPVPRREESRALISPFSRSMGMEVRSLDSAAAHLAMPRGVNEGFGSAIDPGALVSLCDTCAALACMPSLDERMMGSATLSLSAVFGRSLRTQALAIGRLVAEDGAVRSALVEVAADARSGGEPSGRTPRHAAMTALVAYRFVAAETVR